jgi:hypothetical protein
MLTRPTISFIIFLDLPPNTKFLARGIGGNEHNVTVISAHYLDTLLKRLGSMGMKSLYLRYVDNLTRFVYYQSFNDFALYALPTPLLEYIREFGFKLGCVFFISFLDSVFY